ncbi:MAG: hypothetical protein WCP97_06560 [bacterium]
MKRREIPIGEAVVRQTRRVGGQLLEQALKRATGQSFPLLAREAMVALTSDWPKHLLREVWEQRVGLASSLRERGTVLTIANVLLRANDRYHSYHLQQGHMPPCPLAELCGGNFKRGAALLGQGRKSNAVREIAKVEHRCQKQHGRDGSLEERQEYLLSAAAVMTGGGKGGEKKQVYGGALDDPIIAQELGKIGQILGIDGGPEQVAEHIARNSGANDVKPLGVEDLLGSVVTR